MDAFSERLVIVGLPRRVTRQQTERGKARWKGIQTQAKRGERPIHKYTIIHDLYTMRLSVICIEEIKSKNGYLKTIIKRLS